MGHSKYTPKLAEEICDRLAKGESLRAICRDAHMPKEASVRGWVIDNREGFTTQYTRARDRGLDSVADEVFDIADDGRNDWIERENKKGEAYVALNEEAISRSRLRFDARRWYLSKLAPKKYGDNKTVEVRVIRSLADLTDDELQAIAASAESSSDDD